MKLSVVVPAHNSGDALRPTVAALLGADMADELEVLLVENGSADRTWPLAQEIAAADPRVVALQSERGLGRAYAAGIAASTGDVVLLTADDLPFGTSDLSAWAELGRPDAVVIGSKGHPRSIVARPAMRRYATHGFAFARKVVLGSDVHDSQGTLFAPGEWLRTIAPRVDESRWLFSTVVVELAELAGLDVIEVPVTGDAHDHGTRLRPFDAVTMGLGLVRIRMGRGRRRRDLS